MDRWIENRFIVLIYRNYITKYSGRISVLFRGIFIESFAGKMQKKKRVQTDKTRGFPTFHCRLEIKTNKWHAKGS